VKGEVESNVPQFLESAALAIDGRNKGFLRSDSLLVVLIFGGAEDCSSNIPSMWSSFPSSDYSYPFEWCYAPPAGLLYSLDRYVDRFGKHRPNGLTMVAVAGLDKAPTFHAYNDWGVSELVVDFYCSDTFAPTRRPGSLVRSLAALKDPRVDSTMFELCIYNNNYDRWTDLADRILARMNR
jgi:hypothetical protein